MERDKSIYEILFENVKDGIIIIEGDNIEDINKGALEIFKCSKEYAKGKRIDELIPNIKEKIEKALQGEAQVFEIECSRGNGTPFTAEVSLSGIKANGKPLLFAVVRDISSHKMELRRLFLISITDPLTGAYNRRYFKKRLEEEMLRAKRTGRTFSLIMFDVDRFKGINDRYGHGVGDITLKKISRTVKGRIRRTDVFARWGGEEFLILLPETDLRGAITLAEDLRRVINEIEIPAGERVSASFGVTEYRPEDTPQTLKERADKLLYKAKASGGNIIIAE